MYFITAVFAWINLAFSQLTGRIYFPLKSYTTVFNKPEVQNLSMISDSIYNVSGFKAIINTSIPYKIIDDIYFIVLSVLLSILFIKGYKLSEKIDKLEIVKWSLIFSILMAISIPANSSDIYGYIARGAQQTIYQQNPYCHTVSEIKGFIKNPLFCNFMWPHQPTTYGPIFISFAKSILLLSDNNFLISFINFKILNLTIFVFVLFFLIKRLDSKNLYLIAWNPLILIHGIWNAHNDLITGTLILVGLYLIVKEERYFTGSFCLTAGIGIKYVPVFLIPYLIFRFVKDKKALINISMGVLCGIVLISIFSIEYISTYEKINPETSHRLLSNVDLVHKSLIAMIFTATKYFIRLMNFNVDILILLKILKYLFYGGFLFFYIFNFSKKRELIYDSTLILSIFFLFTIAKFHSWYLMNFLFLMPLLKEDSTLKKLLFIISVFHIFSITFIDQAKILNFICLTLIPIIVLLKKDSLNKFCNRSFF